MVSYCPMSIHSFFVLLFAIGTLSSSLHNAIQNHDTNTAIKEIKNGANLGEISGRSSMTALHLAAYKGNYEVCEEILKKNSDYINKFVIVEDQNNILFFIYKTKR